MQLRQQADESQGRVNEEREQHEKAIASKRKDIQAEQDELDKAIKVAAGPLVEEQEHQKGAAMKLQSEVDQLRYSMTCLRDDPSWGGGILGNKWQIVLESLSSLGKTCHKKENSEGILFDRSR